MSSLFKKLFAFLLLLFLAVNAHATPAASFSDVVGGITTLLPDGFWPLVGLVFTAIITIGGIIVGLKLTKKARG